MEARNLTFMFYGFLAAWMILVLYVISLVARERRIRQEVDRLRNMIAPTTHDTVPKAKTSDQLR